MDNITLSAGRDPYSATLYDAASWQARRMDATRDESGAWVEGEPTLADALAVLAEAEAEG